MCPLTLAICVRDYYTTNALKSDYSNTGLYPKDFRETGLVKGKRYLDLGTGNGYVAFEMAKQNSDVFVTGIDIVVKAVEVNNQKAKIEEYHNLNFVGYQGIHQRFCYCPNTDTR